MVRRVARKCVYPPYDRGSLMAQPDQDKIELYDNCELCGCAVRMGQGRYDGQNLPHYKLFVGPCCGDRDEIFPKSGTAFVSHLLKLGIPVPEKRSNNTYPAQPPMNSKQVEALIQLIQRAEKP